MIDVKSGQENPQYARVLDHLSRRSRRLFGHVYAVAFSISFSLIRGIAFAACLLSPVTAHACQDDAATVLSAVGGTLRDLRTGSISAEFDVRSSTQKSIEGETLTTLVHTNAPAIRQRLDMWFNSPARLARIDSTQIIPAEEDKHYLTQQRNYHWSLQGDKVSKLDIDGVLLTASSTEQKFRLGALLPQPFAIWHLPTIDSYTFLGWGVREKRFRWPDVADSIDKSPLADKFVVEVSEPERIVLVARADSSSSSSRPTGFSEIHWEFARKSRVLPIRRTCWGYNELGRRSPITESLFVWEQLNDTFVPVAFAYLHHRHRNGNTTTDRFDMRMRWLSVNEPISETVFDLEHTTANFQDVTQKFDVDSQVETPGTTELSRNLERYRRHVESVQQKRFRNTVGIPMLAVGSLAAIGIVWWWLTRHGSKGGIRR